VNDPESRSSLVVQKAHRIATRTEFASILVFFAGLMGCIVVSARLHEPVPRINDEFSYLLMSDTLASERVSNDPPPLSEFFDTFHVLIRPSYASKYFPAQGVILAVGQKLTGRPAAGLWLGSALAWHDFLDASHLDQPGVGFCWGPSDGAPVRCLQLLEPELLGRHGSSTWRSPLLWRHTPIVGANLGADLFLPWAGPRDSRKQSSARRPDCSHSGNRLPIAANISRTPVGRK
jgi:hypothetical protein